MGHDAAVSTHKLTKHYGSLVAVKNLELEVRPGEIFGFLGLNGAGKTTTIRLLLDLLRPTSGWAEIFGKNCRAKGLEVRKLVGYMPGEMGLYGDMTGGETLSFFANLSSQPTQPALRKKLQETMELSAADLDRKIREYSTGMKRKLGIIQAFQGDPPLLILDEPTEGLDPVMQEAFYSLLFDARKSGKTIFMSSHVLSEVERVCSRIALLRGGELALLATVEEIRKLADRRVHVCFSQDVPFCIPPEYTVIEVGARNWALRVHGPLGPLVHALAGLPVEDIRVEEPRLEDVLIGYYREGLS